MKNLFAYGSLMNDEVWLPLLGETFSRIDATLDGYECRLLHGACYPAMRRAPAGHVDGVLVQGLNAAQLRVLDEFEGVWYRRVTVTAQSADGGSVPCETYVIRDRYRHLLSDRAFDNAVFRARHLKPFIARWGP